MMDRCRASDHYGWKSRLFVLSLLVFCNLPSELPKFCTLAGRWHGVYLVQTNRRVSRFAFYAVIACIMPKMSCDEFYI
jgi:hypothetical protein